MVLLIGVPRYGPDKYTELDDDSGVQQPVDGRG
jgi:hypothetical protein